MGLFYGFVTALVAPVAAQATIIQAGASAEEDIRLEQEAHLAGAKFPCVTAIYMLGTKDWPPVTSGTGVFIGSSQDGKKGLILTAAHIFNHSPKEARALGYQRMAMTFGPDLTSFRAVNAERVFLHPDFTAVALPYFKSTESETAQVTLGHDVAIIQFDLATHAKALKDLGITPAVLCEGGEHLGQPSLEAKTAGFGVFGTNQGSLVPQNVRIHAGDTLVSYGNLRGNNLFMNWSPMSQEASDLLDAKAMAPGLLNRFATLDGKVEVREGFTAKPQLLQTHKHHATGASGDSGGPLFIHTPQGPRVAGIYTRNEHCEVVRVDDGKKLWAMASLWEPVVDHLSWIQDIRHGLEEKALVLEPGNSQWECKGGAGLSPSGGESKLEAQGPESKATPPPPGSGGLPCVIL
jgi:hypothetical protein